jgi:glycine betaine/choline ABC-type transport system substrate-binding protein
MVAGTMPEIPAKQKEWRKPMRNVRKTAYGAALLALVLTLGACGSGVSDDEEPSGGNGEGGGSVASQLTLGGPPECPKRPFCLPGLEETYGIEFAEFKPLDLGGPLTVKALANGQVDVGLLFSTSSAIPDNDFVVLEDDKSLQTAENITPVVRSDVVDDTITEQLNAVSAALDTQTITDLNGRVELDREDPADVAADFLEQEGLLGGASGGSGDLTVGAVAFAENQIVAEMYAQVLEDAGYSVDRQTDLESREIVYPALKSGEIDIAPEYLGSLLLYLDPEAEASGDSQGNADLLAPLLEKDGIELLESSEANDTNAFVVTQETADEFGLETMSDLASEE